MNRKPAAYDRRTVLRTTGTLLATGTLAGCLGGDGDSGDDAGSGDEYESVPEEEEPDYEGWFDTTGNYEGTADGRGESEVGVAVGAGDQGYAFEPAAVMVEPGTTVVWEWTGSGGGHNVVEEDEAFGDDEIHTEEGHTYEHTLEEPGTYRYVCTPHDTQGMRGAIVVEE